MQRGVPYFGRPTYGIIFHKKKKDLTPGVRFLVRESPQRHHFSHAPHKVKTYLRMNTIHQVRYSSSTTAVARKLCRRVFVIGVNLCALVVDGVRRTL